MNEETNVDPQDGVESGVETGGSGSPTGANETAASDARCPVERLVRRFTCHAPTDAADRLLAGLTPERVSCELWRAEVVGFATKALWPSIFLAVFGVASLVGSLLSGPGRQRPIRHLDLGHAPDAPRPNALPLLGGEAALTVEAQRIAVPFTPAPGGK